MSFPDGYRLLLKRGSIIDLDPATTWNQGDGRSSRLAISLPPALHGALDLGDT
jgi:hypothetical protein